MVLTVLLAATEHEYGQTVIQAMELLGDIAISRSEFAEAITEYKAAPMTGALKPHVATAESCRVRARFAYLGGNGSSAVR